MTTGKLDAPREMFISCWCHSCACRCVCHRLAGRAVWPTGGAAVGERWAGPRLHGSSRAWAGTLFCAPHVLLPSCPAYQPTKQAFELQTLQSGYNEAILSCISPCRTEQCRDRGMFRIHGDHGQPITSDYIAGCRSPDNRICLRSYLNVFTCWLMIKAATANWRDAS